MHVALRDVVPSDLPVFFAHQRDPEAIRMAAFRPRDQEAFEVHWAKIMADATLIAQTVVVGGEVAGYIGSFGPADAREVGYWIGREFWGRGVATAALSAFLQQVRTRPLYAHVAKANIGSLRVLERCGFAVDGEDRAPAATGGEDVDEIVLRLDWPGTAARALRFDPHLKDSARTDAVTPAKNTICIWYDHDAEGAASFYATTFPDSSVGSVFRAPGEYPSGKEGDVLTVDFTVMGIPCVGLNGGPEFKHSEAFSFQVATVDQAETDRYWNAIVDNGGEESQCGWCKDKWGVSWQITPIALTQAVTSTDRAAAKRAFDAMMPMKKIDIATIEAALRG